MIIYSALWIDLAQSILHSELFRVIVSAVFGGTVSATVSVMVGMYLNHRLNHIQRVAEATHAVAADTNSVVKDE